MIQKSMPCRSAKQSKTSGSGQSEPCGTSFHLHPVYLHPPT